MKEGIGNPLQYSYLENPMDRGAWWATVHWVAKSWARVSNCAHTQVLATTLAVHSPWPRPSSEDFPTLSSINLPNKPVRCYFFGLFLTVFLFVCLFFCFFGLGHLAERMLAPRSGIEPMLPAVEERSLNHWTAGEVPDAIFVSTLQM